ncbi:MAG: cytochrome P450 [Rhodovulum sulfidophilum]|uniref:Cytochrome P450 n=1 Tax=Rhodovulum sulfidophilum TaxID=35806 RepID=A0A2W5MXT9_RHOSU|nr:MAG: cytochrome P450 [Rhodovulum sulfidophilum]
MLANAIPVTAIDPFDPAVLADSIRVMGELREQAPWVYLEKYGVYATGRHEPGAKMLRDWKSFTSTVKAWGPREHIPSILVAEDPPDHTRHRNALMKFFSNVALKRYQDTFEAYAETFADELVAKGEIDGTEDIGAGFVLRAFPDILGMQSLDRGKLLEFGDLMFNSVAPGSKIYLESKDKTEHLWGWFQAQFHRENLEPGKLADEIYQLGDNGEVDEPTAGQLVRTVFSAGFDTTVLAIGTGVKLLSENPEEWEKLRADPSLLKSAFEETIRYDAPSRVLGRGVTRDIEFEGLTLKDGDKVACFLNAAGHDPRKWEAPDAFIVGRPGASGHLSFGYGIHSCLGQALARLEYQAIIGALARRVKRIEPTGPAVRKINNQACGWAKVPVRLIPA